MIKCNFDILDRTRTYCVAISGGVDSIVGLHFLQKLRYKVFACYYNHNLRHQNYEMEAACKKLCQEFGVDLNIGWRDKKTDNSEAALREDRLAFYRSQRLPIICVHHLNDCVEQYVMNMLKGCPERLPINYVSYFTNNKPFTIYRPFLQTSKETLVSYGERNDLMRFVVSDETNDDTRYRRNWIRNEILPQFENFGLEKVVYKKFYQRKKHEKV